MTLRELLVQEAVGILVWLFEEFVWTRACLKPVWGTLALLIRLCRWVLVGEKASLASAAVPTQESATSGGWIQCANAFLSSVLLHPRVITTKSAIVVKSTIFARLTGEEVLAGF